MAKNRIGAYTRSMLADTDMKQFSSLIGSMNDQLLFQQPSLPRPLPCARYRKWGTPALKAWCYINKLYGLPTLELLEWLSFRLRGYPPGDILEIGAGRSNIGSCISVRQTDQYTYDIPEARGFYDSMNQKPPRPEPEVEKLEALEAVEKYKPRVVIASWVSQWLDPEDPNPRGHGSIFGVKKDELLKQPSVELYIQVSNTLVHGAESVSRSASIVRPGGLASRGEPGKDAIFVWAPQK